MYVGLTSKLSILECSPNLNVNHGVVVKSMVDRNAVRNGLRDGQSKSGSMVCKHTLILQESQVENDPLLVSIIAHVHTYLCLRMFGTKV